MSGDLIVARLSAASALLAEATTPFAVKQVVDVAHAAEVYATRQKLGDQAIGYAHSIKIDALAKLGEMLKKMPKNKGASAGGSKKSSRGAMVELRDKTPTYTEVGIDKKTAMVAQQLAALPVELREQVAQREATVHQARQQVAEQKRADDLSRPAKTELPAGIYHGDFRELSIDIADESIELVFTDPPYDADSVPLYEDAARIAARILKPGGSLIAYSGQRHLPDVLERMAKHLRYWWTIAGVHEGGNQILNKLGIRCGWKPLVWFVKDFRGDVQNVMLDVVRGDREKHAHEWQQAESEAIDIIGKLCPDGGTVVDFCLGGGTTAVACKRLGRNFIGFEINAASVERSAERLAA